VDAIRIVEGDLRVGDLRIALVASRFNENVVERLVAGAVEALVSRDLPAVVRRIAQSGRFDAVVALGAVIRGETAHFDYVAGECAAGLARVADETGVPVAFGVLTTESEEQALERAGGREGNKGADAACAAIELASLMRKLG
jgi:6,7-dimethyl-8-ribityllumazine synthase